MGMFVQVFAGVFFAGLWVLVLGRMCMTWVDPKGTSTLAQFLISTTEPLIAPVRKALPQTGMFDFSSFLVLVVLGFIWRALL